MSTVIIGGGIIGLATAYYLSKDLPPSDPQNPGIHIIDSSHSLLLSASGYAGGFLAKDWFSPASASLGELSFRLHRELADEHDGAVKWGYAPTRTYSLSIDERELDAPRKESVSDNWLSSGSSRVGVAPDLVKDGPEKGAGAGQFEEDALNSDGSPRCFSSQPAGSFDVMAEHDTTALIEPRLLCEFLLSQCKARGVQVHLSATLKSLSTNPAKEGSTVLTCRKTSEDSEAVDTVIPCENLIVTAGAWTPSVFRTLFPSSRLRVPISPLAGTSLLAKSPRYTTPFPFNPSPETPTPDAKPRGQNMGYAVYCGPMPRTSRGHKWTYSPEAFARLGQDSRPEIWVGGLNHPHLALPEKAEDVEALKTSKGKADAQELRACLVQLCGKVGDGDNDASQELNEDDLDVIREGLCFRPVSETGVPVVGKVNDKPIGSLKMGLTGKGGVFVATGHGPWGISLSLGTGKVVSELVTGKTLSADIRRLGLR